MYSASVVESGLQLAVTSNSSPCHHSYKSSSGTSSINAITMRCISVGQEEFIACQIALVGELVISSALDIVEEVFECFLVSGPGLELNRAR